MTQQDRVQQLPEGKECKVETELDLISWAMERHLGVFNLADKAVVAALVDLRRHPPAAKSAPLTTAQVERLYRNIPVSAQKDAASLAAFKRLARVFEAAHGIEA